MNPMNIHPTCVPMETEAILSNVTLSFKRSWSLIAMSVAQEVTSAPMACAFGAKWRDGSLCEIYIYIY